MLFLKIDSSFPSMTLHFVCFLMTKMLIFVIHFSCKHMLELNYIRFCGEKCFKIDIIQLVTRKKYFTRVL